jgi:hypothetical protein
MQAHYEEIKASERGPLALKIYEATKNVMIFKDSPGAAIPDWETTNAARRSIAILVCKRLAAAVRKQHDAGEAGAT